MQCLKDRPAGRFLQLTCVYGSLTSTLVQVLKPDAVLVDVSSAQPEASRKRMPATEQMT